MGLEIKFYLTIVSSILILFFIISILRIKKKQTFQWSFLFAITCMLVWNISTSIIYAFFPNKLNENLVMFYIGICLIAPFFLLSAYFFTYPEKKIKVAHACFFIVPVITLIIAFTNPKHHLLVVEQTFLFQTSKYGPYFIFHSLYSYGCIVTGFYYFIKYSIKNSGVFSRQALLVTLGAVIPFITNILGTYKIISFTLFDTCLSFTVSILLFWMAIINYGFLNIIPIALQQVVNQISDGLIVISRNNILLSFNKTMERMFEGIIKLKIDENIFEKTSIINLSEEKIKALINQAANENKTISVEKEIRNNDIDKHFNIEITPMYSGKTYWYNYVIQRYNATQE